MYKFGINMKYKHLKFKKIIIIIIIIIIHVPLLITVRLVIRNMFLCSFKNFMYKNVGGLAIFEYFLWGNYTD